MPVQAPAAPLPPSGNRGPAGISLPCLKQPGPCWWLRWWGRSTVNSFEGNGMVGCGHALTAARSPGYCGRLYNYPGTLGISILKSPLP